MASKALRIETAPNSHLRKIVWEGGGEIPARLSGTYTSIAAATQAIVAWAADEKKPAPEIKDARVEEEKAQLERAYSRYHTPLSEV